MTDWKWKIGALLGFGECVWQEMAGKIRNITSFMFHPQAGLLLKKSLICTMADHPQFDAEPLVVISLDCPDDLASDADRAWGYKGVVPVNGTPRFKIET